MTNNLPKTEDKQSIESTAKEIFNPTPHMEKWLNTAIQSGSHIIDKISELSGVDESTYYGWRKDPNFIEWYDREYNLALKAGRWRLNAIGMNKANSDHKYWQDMQKITGNLKEAGNTNIQVNVTPILSELKAE